MNVPNFAKMNADMTWKTDKMNKICAVCKTVAKQRCSDCKITYYCGREHQKSDWKSHSKKCRVLELVKHKKIGRCYVAARKIEYAEVVLWEEKPLLIVPYARKSPVCLNCYVPLNCYNAKSCDKCGWPLCKDCNVHGPECEQTMKYRKSKMTIHDYSRALPIYNAVCVLRALALRDKCPSDYDKLISLEGHCEKKHQHWKDGISETSIYQEAQIVKLEMKIDDLDVEKIARVIGIMDVNGFGASTPIYHFRVAIFDKSSYATHDCVPNCFAADLWNDHIPVTIIGAIQEIEKGDLITITYTNPRQGTAQRRWDLRTTKFFDCTCKRCNDPTELGTMFSAIKCFKEDCKGHMLPSTFLISNYDTLPDYVCDKCDSTKSWITVDEVMVAIAKKLSEVDQYNVDQLKKFIDEQAKILHENHFHMFEANCKLSAAWAVMIRNNPTCATEEFLKKNIALCKKLIYLIDRLMPRIFEEQVSFLMRLFEYTWMLDRQVPIHQRSQSQNLNILQETGKILHEVLRLLRLNPTHSPSGVVAEFAQLLFCNIHSAEMNIMEHFFHCLQLAHKICE